MTRAVAQLRAPDSQRWPADWPAVIADAVRPEFRVDVLFGAPGDGVLFGPSCAIAGCLYFQRGGHGLCSAHARQFAKRVGGSRSASG